MLMHENLSKYLSLIWT